MSVDGTPVLCHVTFTLNGAGEDEDIAVALSPQVVWGPAVGG